MAKFLYSVLFTILISYSAGHCQAKTGSPVPFCEKDIVSWDFSSKIIGEDFTIYIHFPPGYDTSKTKYPVLYMTDGDWNMTVAMNCFNMLRQDYHIPNEPLIVGIGYGNRPNKRSRDLNPSTGGPNFLSFIQTEVMPFIQKQYRVTDNKTLYGYSLGGMFTTYVLFEHPGLFNMIGIGAPGDNGNDLIPAAQKYFASHKDLNNKVFLGVGSYEHMVVNNIGSFKAYIDKQNCKDLDLLTAITPNAAHGAALAQVMQNAIAFLYCNKHKPIDLPITELEKYTGVYATADKPDSKLKIYLDNNALYLKDGSNPPIHLMPFRNDGFFMYENERMSILFKTEDHKKYLVVETPGAKPTLIEKIN